MRRILLIVAYDGTNYHGWQLQNNGATIEGELNRAIKELTGEEVQVIGASRTDAGVHGMCNRAVFDTESAIPADKMAMALNTKLPDDIRVRESREVEADWHPRKVSTHKTYEYRIDCERVANPLMSRYAWHIDGPLDIRAMRKASNVLLGEHDFTSFCSVNGTALTNVRTIVDIEVLAEGADEVSFEGEIVLRITGNGFLYNMVRIIVGTLVQVGYGKWTDEDLKNILEAQDRTKAGMTAPPNGLTLVNIRDL